MTCVSRSSSNDSHMSSRFATGADVVVMHPARGGDALREGGLPRAGGAGDEDVRPRPRRGRGFRFRHAARRGGGGEEGDRDRAARRVDCAAGGGATRNKKWRARAASSSRRPVSEFQFIASRAHGITPAVSQPLLRGGRVRGVAARRRESREQRHAGCSCTRSISRCARAVARTIVGRVLAFLLLPASRDSFRSRAAERPPTNVPSLYYAARHLRSPRARAWTRSRGDGTRSRPRSGRRGRR